MYTSVSVPSAVRFVAGRKQQRGAGATVRHVGLAGRKGIVRASALNVYARVELVLNKVSGYHARQVRLDRSGQQRNVLQAQERLKNERVHPVSSQGFGADAYGGRKARPEQMAFAKCELPERVVNVHLDKLGR